MNTSEQIRTLNERRYARLNEMDALLNAAEAGNRDLTADETRQFNNCKGQIARLDAELVPLQEQLMRLAETATPADNLGSLGIRSPFVGSGFAGSGQRESAVAAAIRSSGFLTSVGRDFVGRASLQITVRSLLQGGATGVGIPATALDSVSGYAGTFQRLLTFMPSIAVNGPAIVYNRLIYSAGSPKAAAVAEGSAKPHSDAESVPTTTPIPTWAHYERVSTQLLSDAPQSVNVLEQMLVEALLDKIDAGGYAAMTTAGYFTAFTPGILYSPFDSAVALATQLATNGARQIVVALNPTDAATATLTKTAAGGAGQYVGSPVPAASGTPPFVLVQSSTVAAGKIIGFDTSGAGPQYADRQVVDVLLGMSGTDFTDNLRTLLCEARGCVIVRDSKRIAYGNAVGAPSV